jgi:Tol biopolymer transport system component
MSDASARWRRVEELCHAALERDVSERPAFLADVCGGDSALRREVEALLAHERSAERFLGSPVGAVAAEVMSEPKASLGTRIGAYEILSPLGAGGMGEVYKARDTRLDRIVAIKVLPAQLADDQQFRERFDREARAISALDHPHICALYDVGVQDGTSYLVMQYLEGETLDTRLRKGALPVDQALQYAIQIADALDKAHRTGIVHRDLKPGNVMLTKAGAKLLDFGLAKASGPTIAGAGPSMAPTMPSSLTAQGTILGTFQYMAPEQLEGKRADARSDIFAFGAVVYEMLTARKAFEGDSQASLIASIMSFDPPPITSLQPLTPPALDHVVKMCLAKDPEERWQNAGDLRREVTWIAKGGGMVAGAAQPSARVRRRERTARIIAAVALVMTAAIAVAAVLQLRRAAPVQESVRFDIQTPPTSELGSLALSSDGRQLAFVASVGNDAPRLWVRPLDQVTAQPLVGTEGARSPFWAPDGSAIGFFAAGKLKRIDLDGGAPQVLADAPRALGGTWNGNGVILFAPTAASPLMRVPATGGTPVAVTRLPPGVAPRQGGSHRFPQFLPDGRRFLFLEGPRLYVGSLDGGESSRVAEVEGVETLQAQYAPPGVLLLVRQGALVAYRFDAARGVVSGDPMPVARTVGRDLSGGTFAVSTTGVLVYRAGGERRQLVWVDRAGAVLSTVGPADENALANPELAPDGRRVAVDRTVQGNRDVWLIEVGRGVASRFTSDANDDGSPVWSPDGRHLVFFSTRNGANDLFEKPTSGVGDERPLFTTATGKVPMAWSSDGQFLLYAAINVKTGLDDLWALPMVGERKPFPVVQTPFQEGAAQFSPDGRWVAYESTESGSVAIYIRPFPGPGGQWQVSTAGGSQPRWRPDGRELFYVAPDGRLMAVPIAVSVDRQTLDAGAPMPLFPTRLASGGNLSIGPRGTSLKPQYAVAPDGRFLMNVAVEGATAPPITVVLNWPAALNK